MDFVEPGTNGIVLKMAIKDDFEIIKKHYDRYYSTFVLKGTLPVKETQEGYWGVAASDDIFELFEKINLIKLKSFIDLGSGDGKVVLIASLFTHADGVEADPELIKVSEKMRDELKSKGRFFNMNYLDSNIADYDVVFINPDKPFYELEKKLRKELKGLLVVYDAVYKPLHLKQVDKFVINGVEISLYVNK